METLFKNLFLREGKNICNVPNVKSIVLSVQTQPIYLAEYRLDPGETALMDTFLRFLYAIPGPLCESI